MVVVAASGSGGRARPVRARTAVRSLRAASPASRTTPRLDANTLPQLSSPAAVPPLATGRLNVTRMQCDTTHTCTHFSHITKTSTVHRRHQIELSILWSRPLQLTHVHATPTVCRCPFSHISSLPAQQAVRGNLVPLSISVKPPSTY